MNIGSPLCNGCNSDFRLATEVCCSHATYDDNHHNAGYCKLCCPEHGKLALEAVATKYCVTVGVKGLEAIAAYDDEHYMKRGEVGLFDQLQKIAGVDEVDYEPMFGPYVFFTIEAEHDNQTKRREVQKTILNAIQKGGE